MRILQSGWGIVLVITLIMISEPIVELICG